MLHLVESGRLHPEAFASHGFAMDMSSEAYETFGNVAQSGAVKALMQVEPAINTVEARAEAVAR